MSEREDLKLQGGPMSKGGAQSQQEPMTTDRIDGSLFADADNINIDNENRVPGRDSV